MRFRLNGKRAARILGCAVFCLILCAMAFFNRTLILEPVAAFLHGGSFQEMKGTLQENLLGGRLRYRNELLTLNGGYARLTGPRSSCCLRQPPWEGPTCSFSTIPTNCSLML